MHELPFCYATCDAFGLAEAGIAGFESNNQCSQFFASGCALYQDLFTSLAAVDAPPPPSPPPIAPMDALQALPVTRVFFAGGMSSAMNVSLGGTSALTEQLLPYRRKLEVDDTAEVLTASSDQTVVDACTLDTPNTLCEAEERSNSWIMLDLGSSYTLDAYELGIYPSPHSPPLPPVPKSPEPSPPPPTPPPNPPSPPPSPPPPLPPPRCTTIVTLQEDSCYHQLVLMANNGVCEDGGEGATESYCMAGTDHTDCAVHGDRCEEYASRQLSELPAEVGDSPGVAGFELWVSETSAFFGTRAHTHFGSTNDQLVLRSRVHQKGRYVTLRIFHPSKKLRIDWLRVFESTGRRMEQREKPPQPEEPHAHKPHQTNQTDEQDRSEHWSSRVEVHFEPGWRYPRRAPPGAIGHSAAASVALAVSLARASEQLPNAFVGHEATLSAVCRLLKPKTGCVLGDSWSLVYNRVEADRVESPQIDDDAGFATQLLSEAVEPVVFGIVKDALACALCENALCDACGPMLVGSFATQENALRRVEAELGAGAHASRAIVECVQSEACLAEVATAVATALGARAALPLSTRLVAVAEANRRLFLDAPFARGAALDAHRKAVRVAMPPDEPLRHEVEGRRLQQKTPTLSLAELGLSLQTNHTCYQVVVKNLSAALESHTESTRLWLRLGATARSLCVDCQFPNNTLSCRAHFALVGRMLTRLRVELEQAPRRRKLEAHTERRRQLEAHVRERLASACCVRRADGREECGEEFCEVHARNVARTRVAAIARKLHERSHPEAERMGAGMMVGVDVLTPELHPDPECRDTSRRHPLNLSGPTSAECMGRSALIHIAKKHGVSHADIRARMETVGIDLGSALTGVARATGLVRAHAHQGGPTARSAFETQSSKDTAQAQEFLSASRRRVSEGRRLQARDQLPEARDVGAHAAQAGRARRAMGHSSAIVRRGLKALDLKVSRANNRHRRAARASGPIPETKTMTPITAFLALQAEEGSMASRFGGALGKVAQLRTRVAEFAELVHTRSNQQASRKRRLAATPIDPQRLYDEIEAHQGRRLAQQNTHVLELPAEHALSWLHDVVDWDALGEETSRLHAVAKRRLEARRSGMSQADAVRAHTAGVEWFDRAHQPTAVGEAFRRAWHWHQHQSEPPWHHPDVGERVNRRLKDASRMRRLASVFWEGTISAPFTFVDTFTTSGLLSKQSRVSFWEASLRYIVSSTVGCYFTAPVKERSETQGGGGAEGDDGDSIKVLRPSSEKMCFPAWPFLLPRLGSFREVTNTVGVDLYGLTYERFCTRDGVAQRAAREIEAFGFDATSDDPFLPNAAILRSAEAIDAVANAARSGSHASKTQSAGYILCSIVELGGVIYVLFIVLIATLLLAFFPCVNYLLQLCFDATTAGIALSTGRPELRTRSAASGGQTRVAKALVGGAERAGKFNKSVLEPGARKFAKAASSSLRASVDPFYAAKLAQNSKTLQRGAALAQRGADKAANYTKNVDNAASKAGKAAKNAAGLANNAINTIDRSSSNALSKLKALDLKLSGRGPTTQSAWSSDEDDGPLLSEQARRATKRSTKPKFSTIIDETVALGRRVMRLGVEPRNPPPPSPPTPPLSPTLRSKLIEQGAKVHNWNFGL